MKRIKNSILTCFRLIGLELAVLFVFLFTLNNFQDKTPTTLNADGIGYYEYLPSAFIRHDLIRKDIPLNKTHHAYKNLPENIGYVEIDGRMVNKYPIGTAVLESPFFFLTKFFSSDQEKALTGYEPAFQRSMQIAAIFYLFWGLVFIKLLLRQFNINSWMIALGQILLLLATPVIFYASADAGFSHVYSFFAIAAFAYFAKRFFTIPETRTFLWACVFLGLILLIRQINVLVIFSLPFLAGSWPVFLAGMRAILGSKTRIISGIAIGFLLLTPQLIVWYLQTGHWIVYSYQGETFDFTQPHFFDILFSYKKGLFVYTPLFFIAIVLSCFWAFQRKWYLFLSYWFFFTIITYVLSSWWSWFYGCSFGMRAFIDFFPILILPLLTIPKNWSLLGKSGLFTLCLLFIPVNLIQSNQYKRFILHWIDMDKQKYWQVFLKTDPKYQGLIWKPVVEATKYRTLETFSLNELRIQESGEQVLADLRIDTLNELDQLSLISWEFEHTFPEKSDVRLRLTIADSSFTHVMFSHEIPLIHFQNTGFDQKQRGTYPFTFAQLPTGAAVIRLTAISDEKTVLKNGSVRLFGPVQQ